MNKKFSTLLVSALLASGAAFTAQADSYVPVVNGTGDIDESKNAYVKVGSDNYLAVENGAIVIKTSDDIKKAENMVNSLWTIKSKKNETPAGVVYTYSVINNATGQALSVNLKTNTTGHTRTLSKIEKGNSEWAWDDKKGLYAQKGDSTFFLNSTTTGSGENVLTVLTLNSVKGDLSETPVSPAVTYEPTKTTDYVSLDAKGFAAVAKSGKLYFNNGKKVSEGQTNVLTDNTWTAEQYYLNTTDIEFLDEEHVSSATSPYLFLTNGVKVAGRDNAMKETTEKKQYLVVDHQFYDDPVNSLIKLAVDTLSFDPVYVTLPKDKDGKPLDLTAEANKAAKEAYIKAVEAAQNEAIGKRTATYGKHHPFAAAFKAKYYVANDSIVLTAQYAPKEIEVKTAIESLVSNANDGVKTYFNKKAISALLTEVTSFINTNSTDKKFDEKGELVKAANEAIKEAEKDVPTGENDKAAYDAEKALVDALINGIAGLKWNSDGDLVSTKYPAPAFANGVSPLEVTAASKNVVLRTLAGTTVVTLAAGKGDIDPLIQVYESKPVAGGNAEIAEGLYYIKNMSSLVNGKANPIYGKYYDQSPVNATRMVDAAQAFNPYAQFVVTPAAGADKGNYEFIGLASNSALMSGVVMKAGDNYVINGDTIALEAAGKLADVDKYIGSANFTAAELKNNTFAIASASAVLKGETFAMLEDSTITLAADEVAFKLVAGSEAGKQGYGEKLAYVPYAIMTEDSLAIAKVGGKYVFTTIKAAEKVNNPVYFRLLATGSESTYVLYDVTKDDNAKVGINVQTKVVIPAALTALNDLFTVTANEAPASYKTTGETAKIQIAKSNLAINDENQAVSVREGDLRAAYTEDDFVFTLDTAKYEGAETYSYFITKEVADAKLIMWEASDSADVAKVKDPAPYYSGLNTRVLFRTLNKIDNDTVYVANLADLAKEDTVKASTSYQFSFAQKSDDAADGYIMQSGDKYVAVANGVVVVTKDVKDAATVEIETVEGPTANEAVAAAEVSVVGANGAIIVKGAAGKVVTVANILGQTIANQVAVSDNVTIAAPAGVAIVTIDGEATKVVVK